MKYYSTNGQAPIADLQKAVVKGLAEDRGLYMPEEIYKLPKVFFGDIQDMKFKDIAYNVAQDFFGDDVDGDALQDIVYDTLSFDCPVVKVTDNIFAVFHCNRIKSRSYRFCKIFCAGHIHRSAQAILQKTSICILIEFNGFFDKLEARII